MRQRGLRVNIVNLKQRILSAARECFRAGGVDGVSMRRVARRVGVSATAIYRYYRDKDELLEAVTEEGFARFEEYLRRAAGATPLERLRSIVLAYVDFAIDHPNHYDFIFVAARANTRQFPRDFDERRSVTFELVREQVAEGMECGQLAPDDAPEATLTIWATLHGFAALYLAGRFGTDDQRFRDLSCRAIERLLSGMAA